ncbi:T9SS type A sorting domain-containing protein [Gilvibacter sp.]|uniref:T9SS type A sorting domain-containing protein n=1 Tax=Gilvibacter sp. TaxID=2729997 RepID=UPI003F49CD50
MKQFSLLILGLLLCSQSFAQDPDPGDFVFERDWFSWHVILDGDYFQRPSPNDEQEYITMDIAFGDPAVFTSQACGSVSLNMEFVEYSFEFGTALITDVVIEPDPCDLDVNNTYTAAYFEFLAGLEGQIVEWMITISTPSGAALGPLGFQIEDNDGNYAFWADIPLSVSDFQFEDTKLYPNPALDILQWSQKDTQTVNARVYTVDGRLLLSETVSSQQIDVSDLSAGIYLLELSSSDGKTVKRFIKQ